MRILLVDNSHLNQHFMKQEIAKTGDTLVAVADTGIDAIRMYEETMPDIVYLNLLLQNLDGSPGLNSIETLGHIRGDYNPDAKVVVYHLNRIASIISEETIISATNAAQEAGAFRTLRFNHGEEDFLPRYVRFHREALSEQPSLIKTHDGNSKSILLALKTPSLRSWARRVLEFNGYTISAEAGTSVEAVRAYNSCRAVTSLVLMDRLESAESSFTAIKALHQIDSDPCVLYTEAGEQHLVMNAITSGAKDFVAKPLSQKSLLERVEKALR